MWTRCQGGLELEPADIEQAKHDWAAQRMGIILGETDWVALPA